MSVRRGKAKRPGRAKSPQKRQLAAAMLGAGQDPKDVCEATGMHRATLDRWRKDPKFMAEVERIANEIAGAFVLRAKGMLGEAITTAYNVMMDSAAPHSARIAAAKLIAEWAGVETAAKVKVEGGSKPVRIESAIDVSVLRTMSPEQLRALAEAAPPEDD
jgi:hypothetical protein